MLLTIGYITARKEPAFEWFFDSLAAQLHPNEKVQLIIVDYFAQACDDWKTEEVTERSWRILRRLPARLGPVRWVPPKPTVWAGPHRLTKGNWWHAACARNTALCLAEGDWFACVDDRCVLGPDWLQAVREAMHEKRAICGSYEKRTGITVESGVIRHAGIVTGEDSRVQYVKEHYHPHGMTNPYSAPGEWWYGCSTALPTDWALRINGYDELCDSSSGEDYIFGLMLQNNGFPIYFDTRLHIIEDRTPEFLGVPMIRRDKGVSPNDKSHSLLARLRGQRRAQHPWDLRQVRTEVARGKGWPKADWPQTDWYDGQPLREMTP